MTDSSVSWSSLYGFPDYSLGVQDLPSVPPTFPSPVVEPMTYGYLGRAIDGQFIYDLPNDYSVRRTISTCTRRYSSEWDSSSADTVGTPSEAYPPSSYLKDPQKHESYMTFAGQTAPHGSGDTEHELGSLANLQDDPPSHGTLDSPVSSAASLSSTRSAKEESPHDGESRSRNMSDSVTGARTTDDETDVEENEPYAKLIYRALMSAPDHRMVLKDIYGWFDAHTDKSKSPNQKGWQNSIRHNLSMNGAFTKVEQDPSPGESKRRYIWVLEPNAIERGVKSTTRYRIGPSRRTGKTGTAAFRRQVSGRKGGQAARRGNIAKASRLGNAVSSLRRHHFELSSEHCRKTPASQLDPGGAAEACSALNDYRQSVDPPAPSTKGDPCSCIFQDVVGVADAFAHQPLFCDDCDHGKEDQESHY
ncbi:MAG: hypothetical protein M1837_001987 [Sclerophora amabilis]|nr:MAG: hypothetical protein M1837_001987 [Sclerophora amabilis]